MFFVHSNLFFFAYLGPIRIINGRRGLGWPAIRKTGPNDAFCVVWAIGKSFFFFLCFLFILTIFFFAYLGPIRVINGRRGLGWPAIRKTGPNDAFCVVWAMGKSFFLFSLFFIHSNRFFLFI